MGFESLPGHNIRYSVPQYPVIPRPPVSPTAAMAAQLAKEITDLGDRMSPEQRQLKETQLAILGTQARIKSQEEEINAMRIQRAREDDAEKKKSNSEWDKRFQDSNSLDDNNDQSAAPNVTIPPSITAPMSLAAKAAPTTQTWDYYDNKSLPMVGAPDTSDQPIPDETDQTELPS